MLTRPLVPEAYRPGLVGLRENGDQAVSIPVDLQGVPTIPEDAAKFLSAAALRKYGPLRLPGDLEERTDSAIRAACVEICRRRAAAESIRRETPAAIADEDWADGD